MRNRRRRRIFPVISDSYKRAGIGLCRVERPGLRAAESAAVATGFALVTAVRWCEDGYRVDLKDFCLMITIRGSQAVVAGACLDIYDWPVISTYRLLEYHHNARN